MPPSVPEDMLLQLSRARMLPGREALHDEWMQMLHDRYDECIATLGAERMAFEATFRHTEPDGTTWIYHLQLLGNDGGGLDTSNPIDAAHDAFARRVKEPGWEDLQPVFMLAPSHILEEMHAWSQSGDANG